MNIIVTSLLNGFIFSLYCYFVSYAILQKKEINKKKIFFAVVPFLLMYYCILCLLDSIYAIFFSGICSFWFVKISFQENIYMSLFISTIIHALKIIFKIMVLYFINDENLLLINTYKSLDFKALYVNVVTIVLSIILVTLIKKYLRKLVKYVAGLKWRQHILLFIIYFIFIIILFFQPPYKLSFAQMVTDLLMIFTVTGIGVFNISSEMKMEAMTRHYNEMFEYSKVSGELLYNYKIQVHENQNKLMMIRSMLDSSKKDTKKYIDSILSENNISKKNNNYWITELRHINSTGIRNFINCKLIQLKKLGAQIEVFVSSDIENVDVSILKEKEYNHLTTILGVILDNMIDAIAEVDEKLISINLYIENNEIHGEFVNTFSGEVDLGRLNEVGYTTKGEQHGVGLSLVEKITKTNNRFQCQPSIMDNFFIQHLTINVWNKKNLQKMSKK